MFEVVTLRSAVKSLVNLSINDNNKGYSTNAAFHTVGPCVWPERKTQSFSLFLKWSCFGSLPTSSHLEWFSAVHPFHNGS